MKRLLMVVLLLGAALLSGCRSISQQVRACIRFTTLSWLIPVPPQWEYAVGNMRNCIVEANQRWGSGYSTEG